MPARSAVAEAAPAAVVGPTAVAAARSAVVGAAVRRLPVVAPSVVPFRVGTEEPSSPRRAAATTVAGTIGHIRPTGTDGRTITRARTTGTGCRTTGIRPS